MDVVYLTERANQKVVDDPKTVLNKRVDYLMNGAEHKLYLKDNNYRPTNEIIMYFPHQAIQAMMTKNVVKKYVYLILYSQEEGSKLDRYEEPYIWNDHDFDKVKGLTKQEIVFHKKYKQLQIYGLYTFDSDADAKVFFRAFLIGVNCAENTVFLFSKRKIDTFSSYMEYMKDRDRSIEPEPESEPEPDPEPEPEDEYEVEEDPEELEEDDDFAPYESD